MIQDVHGKHGLPWKLHFSRLDSFSMVTLEHVCGSLKNPFFPMAKDWPRKIFHGHWHWKFSMVSKMPLERRDYEKAHWWMSSWLEKKNSKQDGEFFIARPHFFQWRAMDILDYFHGNVVSLTTNKVLNTIFDYLAGKRTSEKTSLAAGALAKGPSS